MRGLDRRLRRLEGAGRRQVQDMSDEELNREVAELAAPILGVSFETLAAEIPLGIHAAKLAELRLEIEKSDC